MQMDNIKALITPLTLYYTSSKPYSILVKLKRILISTGYQLQKFECKKQSQLKNNMADFSSSSIVSTFSFKLSKQFELSNTKVQIMVFGFLNKDIKLLGVATLDLGVFQHIEPKNFPILKEIKVKLQKSEDANAYIIAKLQLDKHVGQTENINNKKVKNHHEFGGNSLVTESDKKQTLIAGRRKQYDMPSAYEISRKNYKNVQITRNTEDRSTSRNRNDSSGSYRKRFQYQYSRNTTYRQNGHQQDEPQHPPTKKPQTKPQQKGSPMPRVKTPRPITQFEVQSRQKQNQRDSYSKQKQIPNKWNSIDGYSKNNKNKMKVIIDIYKEKRVIQMENYEEKGICVEGDGKRQEERGNVQQDDEEFEIKQTGRFVNTQRNQNDGHLPGKISQQHVHNSNKGSPTKSDQIKKQHKYNITDENIDQKIKSQPLIPQKPISNSQNYTKYREQQSTNEQSQQLKPAQKNIRDNPNKTRDNPNKQPNNSTNPIKNQPQLPTPINPNPQTSQKPNSNDNSANRFKSITDKLQQIQHRIKQKRKSQSPSGPTKQQISSQNTFGYNQEDDDYQYKPRKPFSPFSTKQKYQNNQVGHGETGKREKMSVNTFRENQFNSIQEGSPVVNGHIGSFDYLGQSQVRVQDQGVDGLDRIVEENGNVHSDSIIDISGKSPLYPKNQKNRNKQQKQQQRLNFKKQDQKIQQKGQKNTDPVKKEFDSSFPQTENGKSNFENSVANFSINQRDLMSQQKDMNDVNKKSSDKEVSQINTGIKKLGQSKNSMKQSKKEPKVDIKTDSSPQKNINKKLNDDKEVNQMGTGINKISQSKNNVKESKKESKAEIKTDTSPQKNQNKLQESIKLLKKNTIQQALQNSNKQDINKKRYIKKYKASNQVNITIEPTLIKSKISEQPIQKKESKQNQINNKDLHKNCDQRINQLQNLLDHQQQAFRKQLMQKQLQLKKSVKKQETKACKTHEEQLQRLRQQNNKLKQKLKQMLDKQQKSMKSIQSKESKQNIENSQEFNKLKDQNTKLRNLVQKLNNQLEQVDEKHFQALTVAEKKDLEFQRKMDVLNRKNIQLLAQIQNMNKQNKQQAEKIKKLNSLPLPQNQPFPSNLSSAVQSQKTIKADADGNQKSFQQEYFAEKKKTVNLQAQLRQKNNEIKFLKIKNDNLMQEKKDLENQIDNIAINNKLQMAKQGSISKMNLQSASVANSVKVQNKVLKDEICSLRRQVHELNGILEVIILEGNKEDERISSNIETSERQHIENLQKKYKALEKKTEAYEQQIKSKQMKIAQIINVIFSHGNPKLMDQISNLVGMS